MPANRRKLNGAVVFGTSVLDANLKVFAGNIPPGAPQPLGWARFEQEGIYVGFYGRKKFVKYTDIEMATGSKWSYIKVRTRNPKDCFMFGGVNNSSFTELLKEHNVPLTDPQSFAQKARAMKRSLLSKTGLGLTGLVVLALIVASVIFYFISRLGFNQDTNKVVVVGIILCGLIGVVFGYVYNRRRH